jgi:hypothetical protein
MVFADGGQLEIVDPSFGRLWQSIPELIEAATEMMRRSPDELDRLGTRAHEASRSFGLDRFEERARRLVAEISTARDSSGVARRVDRLRRRLAYGVNRVRTNAMLRARRARRAQPARRA